MEIRSHSESVRAMFTRIAGRYDLMNTLMTGGRHHAWRRYAATTAATAPAGPILDLATGTADLAIALQAASPGRQVVGADFSLGMLTEAQRKLAGRSMRRIPLVAADALALPFANKTFACVTSAFLLRNLGDLPTGLREMRRVTRPGGLVIALEIIRPDIPGWDTLFALYFRRVVPLIGALIAGDRQAYTYLPKSVDRYLSPRALARLMTDLGYRDVTYRRYGLGAIALHVGRVPRSDA
jgi:demethylmenaquinone methyltransferase / 2-methoxy-6-polyprenyl-1,4-benzoquinol methylase